MLENKSFELNGILSTIFAERPIPDLSPDEVLVEMKKTGICGSDMHYYTEGRLGHMGMNLANQPFVLGHESSGVVAKVGSNVTNVDIGDRVAIEPGVTCRTCHECKSGNPELCGKLIFPTSVPGDGTLQRYCKYPAASMFKLPDHLTLEDGAMMEPLTIAIHAVSHAGQVHAGQNVVVFGAGPIGLLCMAVARAEGAVRVIAVDIVPSRLEFAKQYAATEIFLSPPINPGERKMEYSKRTAEMMKKALGIEERGPNGIDLVVDATGAETCIQTGIMIARCGGTYVQAGFGPAEVQIPITTLLVKEIIFKGANLYGPDGYQRALALASSGKVDLKPIVTHRFKFEGAVEAFETVRAGKSVDASGKVTNVIKVIISGPDVDPAAP